MTDEQYVERIVRPRIVSCGPDTPLVEAAARMHAAQCSSIVVMDGERPLGIWTERDALHIDFDDPSLLDISVSEVMSAPVKTLHRHTTLSEAGLRFRDDGVRHFVVVDDDGAAIGVVSQSDVVVRHGVEHFLILRDVRTALHGAPLVIDGGSSLTEAVRLMRERGTDAAVVLTANGPGIITERDVVRLISGRCGRRRAAEVASAPIITIGDDASLLAARNLLVEKGIRHLGVTNGKDVLVGLISFSDILATLQYEYLQRLDEALKERDDALLRSRRDLHLARKVIEASLDGIIICNADKLIEFVNPAFTELTGYAADEVIGRNPRFLQSGRQREEFYRDMWEALNTRAFWQGEIWNRRKDGSIYPEWLTITVLRDEDGNVDQYAAIFSDISERKKTEEKIKNLAYFDVLTGLPNRRLFNDRLSVALASAHRHGHELAVMFLDLDLFKRINDTLGHSVGDQVLVEMAQRLSGCIREGDTVARLGGDEFIVLLPELDEPEDAAKLAERMICQIKAPFLVDRHELYVTTSIGISIFPDDGATVEALVKNADTAMYRAKDTGRNSYQLYAPAMNARSFERLAMESSLRHALVRDEFRLAYQVKVDMASGRMSGVEALARWHHPEMGLVPPMEFVPLAESMGLISAVGEWVLHTACRQNKAWHDLGLPKVRVAVNVSAEQFRDTDVAAVVERALEDTGLEPRYLELELTETVLMQRVDEISKVLHRLRDIGVRISIDDFGTGYSSLNYLRRMPIDALKIDRSFVRDVTCNRDDAEIVSTIISLAHNLRMKAVAEGVERPEQAAFLRVAGCDEIQGYLIGRPVSADDLISLFDRHLLPQPEG